MRDLVYSVLAGFNLIWLVGCAGSLLHSTSLEMVAEAPPEPDVLVIGDVARPYGMNYVQVEAVALVNGLAGTGEDPAPTPQRVSLLAEMQRREVKNPSTVLASPDTALVLVRGLLRPGIQEGDAFDVEVKVPSRSETTSLRGGWLLPTRLSPLAVMGNQIHNGRLLGTAKGPVLVDPAATSDTPLATRGRVLGGGVAVKNRPLGLILDHQHKSVRISSQIGVAVNRRFHTYINGSQKGMATPKTDDYVELLVHPRYKDNVARYMRVVRNIPIRDSVATQDTRLQLLESQLMDPLTTATAAIRLEANASDEARAVLRRALDHDDAEVRFYAAEALAYLDDTAAAEPLAAIVRNAPAFRLNALAALSAMDDPLARNALRGLLERKSAETRYGAFRALWAMDPNEPSIRGNEMDGKFSLHVLKVGGPPMIHATRSYRPEIVLFGDNHEFRLPLMIEAGRRIVINGTAHNDVVVSRFAAGEPIQKRTVSARVEEVIGAIVELGGTYPDVVQVLQEANDSGALTSRFRVDALPEPGRTHERSAASDTENADLKSRQPRLATPIPELFSHRK